MKMITTWLWMTLYVLMRIMKPRQWTNSTHGELLWILINLLKSNTYNFTKTLFVSSFFMFFCEGSDDQYPSGSIMCMYVTFNWLLKVAKEKWMVFSSVSKPKFCMKTHPLCLQMNWSLVKIMRHSRNAKVNKDKCENDGITWKKEQRFWVTNYINAPLLLVVKHVLHTIVLLCF